ncbi:hypothetical protein ACFQZC_01200 [Streptacidiphilus monticola]
MKPEPIIGKRLRARPAKVTSVTRAEEVATALPIPVLTAESAPGSAHLVQNFCFSERFVRNTVLLPAPQGMERPDAVAE